MMMVRRSSTSFKSRFKLYVAPLLEAYNKVGRDAVEQVQGASSALFAWQCDDADEETEEDEDEDTADIFYDKEPERGPLLMSTVLLQRSRKSARSKKSIPWPGWNACV